MENFNTKIIAEIKRQMPNKKRPVNYLIELLSLGKESAYRRIKNQIPFTFDEVAIIANDLDLSIDLLLEQKINNRFSFGSEFNPSHEPFDTYVRMFEYDNAVMEKMLSATDLKITATLNRLPLRFFPYYTLFKFEYFHYQYSIGRISLMAKFSDMVVPPQIVDLQKKSTAHFFNLKNICCIMDNMVYSKILREIKYYYQLKFISIEDLHTLQTELFELLDLYESLLRNGKNQLGSEYIIYYSLLNLDTNTIFVEYDNNSLLLILIYPESPIVIKDNPMIFEIQKRWLDSKIRNSVLISKTNDTLQIESLREIYRQISDLTKIDN